MYKSIRMAEPRYVRSALLSPLSNAHPLFVGGLGGRLARLHGDRDPPRPVVHVQRRLLVARMHPLRVSLSSFMSDRHLLTLPSLLRFLSGFPPFSGASSEETWLNLKNWSKSLRRPHYDRPEDRIFNLSDVGWSAITSCVLPSRCSPTRS